MNDEHVRHLLSEDVVIWNAWRVMEPKVRTDLSKATLSGVDLSGATLSGIDLTRANLSGAK